MWGTATQGHRSRVGQCTQEEHVVGGVWGGGDCSSHLSTQSNLGLQHLKSVGQTGGSVHALAACAGVRDNHSPYPLFQQCVRHPGWLWEIKMCFVENLLMLQKGFSFKPQWVRWTHLQCNARRCPTTTSNFLPDPPPPQLHLLLSVPASIADPSNFVGHEQRLPQYPHSPPDTSVCHCAALQNQPAKSVKAIRGSRYCNSLSA